MPRIALTALQQRNYLTGTGRYLAELYHALPTVVPDLEYLLYVKPDQAALYPSGGPGASQRVLHSCPSSPPLRAAWELVNLLPQIRRDRIDVYHGPANFLPPRKVCPYVLTLHDMVYFHNPKRTFLLRAKYWQWYLRATWRLADAIITDSEFSRDEIRRYLPVPADRIRVIPIGVHPKFFAEPTPEQRAAMRAALGLERPYILYVGRLDPDKNVERMIRASAAVIRERGLDHEIVLAGTRDWGVSGLPALVKELGIDDRVRAVGYVAEEHLIPLYREADVFCFPSLNEGFGLPPLEAMAAGVPVVTSSISSLPEVVGEAGIQVDPFDVGAIARGMAEALDPATAAQLRVAGPRRARAFTWERTARETAEVYRQVLSR